MMVKYICVVVILLTFWATNLKAQLDTSSASVDSATIYLTGTYKKYDPHKSFTLFMQRALGGEPKAMNALGMHYTKGLGVDSNFNEAVYWFTLAARAGYTKAWVNLGMLHKRIAEDSAGYVVANNYFDSALLVQEASAYFAKGYMLYKGLGCNQSYAEAINLFRSGVAQNRPDCMYFIGLCFKHGFGVAANSDSATFYIDNAAKRGYRQANALFAEGAGTSARGNGKVVSESLVEAKDPFRKVYFSRTSLNIDGKYLGELVEYDYSGKFVTRQMPLELDLKPIGNRLVVQWKQGNDKPIMMEARMEGNKLKFSGSNFLLTSMKAKANKQTILFKSATLNQKTVGNSLILEGNVIMYNTFTKETTKPIAVKLVKAKEQEVLTNRIAVLPNPVKSSFTVSIFVEQACKGTLQIFNQDGILLYIETDKRLAKGKNLFTLNKNLGSSGVYLIQFRNKNVHLSTAFLKE